MSTKSILKSVIIEKNDTALLFAEALEKSAAKEENKVMCIGKCSNIERDSICSFFDN